MSITPVGRVLLIEDDPAVRCATRMLLAAEGYPVAAVGSLQDALQAAGEKPTVDLVITDYHLNGRETGIQVIAALRELLGRPVKALLMTGDISSAIRDLPRDRDLRIANKPLQAEEMLTILHQLMADDALAAFLPVGSHEPSDLPERGLTVTPASASTA